MPKRNKSVRDSIMQWEVRQGTQGGVSWQKRMQESDPESWKKLIELIDIYNNDLEARDRIGTMRQLWKLLRGEDPDRKLDFKIPEVSADGLRILIRSRKDGEVH